MSQTRKQGKDGFSAQLITDWKGLVDLLASFRDGKWIYRGQSQDRPLATSLERRLDAWGIELSSGPRVKRQLIREFRRRLQGAELDDVMNDKLFCLALMQHHSPFVAAQFAVRDGQTIENGKRTPHVIWCFRAEWLENQAASKVGRKKVDARNNDKARSDS